VGAAVPTVESSWENSVNSFYSAKSHLSATIVNVTKKIKSPFFGFPVTAHKLQPLDKSMYKPSEDFWDEALQNYRTIQYVRKIM
jgi:hypothetical protein